MKTYFQWMVVPVLLVTLILPQGAQAATTHQTSAQQQQIAQLYALVAQLQAQLNALLAAGGSSAAQTNYLSVQTLGVKGEDDDAVELSGRVDYKRDGDARVWFEYGTSISLLSYSTPSYELPRGKSGRATQFDIIAPDLRSSKTYYYRAVAEGEDGRYAEGTIKSFRYDGDYDSGDNDNDNDDDTPDATTDDADDVDDNSAELSGDVDMNDYDNGIAFFVFGEDEDAVADVTDEDRYADIDTNGDELRKVLLSSNLDSARSFTATVSGLDEDTEHFFRICVEYEDEDDDDTLVCGDVESFETDNN